MYVCIIAKTLLETMKRLGKGKEEEVENRRKKWRVRIADTFTARLDLGGRNRQVFSHHLILGKERQEGKNERKTNTMEGSQEMMQ
jgi:hypothetical protein